MITTFFTIFTVQKMSTQSLSSLQEENQQYHFIDVWVENSSLVENIRQLDMVAGEWVRMEKVKCVKEGAGGSDIFRFSVVDGKIKRLKMMEGGEESQTEYLEPEFAGFDKNEDLVMTKSCHSEMTDLSKQPSTSSTVYD